MNLYEILEVSENASEETINKIYKIQAKRYHPDLQTSETKKLEAQEKMKKINEAYSILSDANKRKEYDEKLKQQREEQKQIEKQQIINEATDEYNEKVQKTYYNQVQLNNKVYNENQQDQNVYTKKDYIRDYNKRLRKLKFQNWKENFIINLKVILIMVIILTFIWLFPPTHKFLVNMYEENFILQAIVEIFNKIINSFKNL